MACFLVPAAEAVVTTVVTKVIKSKEKESETIEIADENGISELCEKLPFSHKLQWLSNLLWGGSALLAFEHLWHGEITPWFPFLRAESTAGMLHEMSTVGIAMAGLVTAVWCVLLLVCGAMEKKIRNYHCKENAPERG